MTKVISFPHMGNYYIPIKYLIENTTICKVLVPPPITKKTISIGSKHSPDYVCVPFKYNLGNFIEALDKGANIILQAGGGCRYGYYAELQEQILKDLNYEFEFINFKISIFTFYCLFLFWAISIHAGPSHLIGGTSRCSLKLF